jgi:dTDP-4-amino-4,6-dideoxygalactose transaminase
VPRSYKIAAQNCRFETEFTKDVTVGTLVNARSVPLLDLKKQYHALAAEIIPVLEAVCGSQQFILGQYVTQFESAAASYCRSAHAIGVSSGTDALLLALMALGIGPGDEVITTPYTFFATAGTVVRSGARPIFCDIDPISFNISPSAVRQFITDQCERRHGVLVNRSTGGRVRALMPVHLFGQCAEMEPLLALAKEHQLALIEDAAQAIGADDAQQRRAGSLGDIGCLSFFPTKNLGAFGDAGMCTTQNQELAEHMRILRVHGGKPKYFHAFIGGNFRIDEIQAAVLAIKLKYLDAWTAGRQRNAQYYSAAFARAGLTERVQPPVTLAGFRHIWNQYCVLAPRRDELRSFLTARGVGTEIYYPVPMHRQPCFAYLGYPEGAFPESERVASRALALPIYPELQPEELQYVVDQISAFYS